MCGCAVLDPDKHRAWHNDNPDPDLTAFLTSWLDGINADALRQMVLRDAPISVDPITATLDALRRIAAGDL